MKHYCEDSCLELRGCKGDRWPMDPTRYTWYFCYRCGRTWATKEMPYMAPKRPRREPFSVYKYVPGGSQLKCTQYDITEGAIGFEIAHT